GLRALYFVLAAMVHRFEYLQYALSLVLIFIGVKVLAHEFIKISPELSLIVTFALLTGGILISLWKTRGEENEKSDALVK
ncbi:MAG: TerC family protein, partial [Pseudomonadota bacterium]